MATGKTYEDVWASSDDAYKARFGGDKAKAIKAMSDWNAKQSASKEVKEIAPETSQMDEHSAQMDARDTKQNQAMQQTVNNATASGGGAIKNSGSGNTFAAALTPDGSGYTPLDSFYGSAANRAGMTPQFSPGEDSTNPYTKDDIHFDSTTNEGIEDRFTYQMNSNKDKRKSEREANKLGRQNRRAMKPTSAERKEKRQTERQTKKDLRSDTRFDKKHGTNVSGLR
tara:strand:+ start:493 stop:1170 length:678 start_codon:yes stop_codon:yes gene_type:complete